MTWADALFGIALVACIAAIAWAQAWSDVNRTNTIINRTDRAREPLWRVGPVMKNDRPGRTEEEGGSGQRV